MKIDELKVLAQQLREADKEACTVNIGILPKEDIWKFIKQANAAKRLWEYILASEASEQKEI